MTSVLDGRGLSDRILLNLAGRVTALKQAGIYPKLQVILVGDDPASLSYIKQKVRAGERAGIIVTVTRIGPDISESDFRQLIASANSDPTIHGVIVQRPVPIKLYDVSEILNSVSLAKDVDGFLTGSPYTVPVAEAVEEILREVESQMSKVKSINRIIFINWLRSRKIVVIGRGETAGMPIYTHLKKITGFESGNERLIQIHTRTENPDQIIKQADIVISCVGKPIIMEGDSIKRGAVLISVGLGRDDDGNLKGDYVESEIASFASFYTPTPGGVGPVNVACLMKNTVTASQKQK